MVNNKKNVLKYYDLIDSRSLSEVFSLFSEKVIYERGGKTISGKGSFKKFYLEERNLEGKHTIFEINSFEEMVIVKGVFNGVNSYSDVISIGFVDYFYFNEFEKIRRRETFTASGYKLIK